MQDVPRERETTGDASWTLHIQPRFRVQCDSTSGHQTLLRWKELDLHNYVQTYNWTEHHEGYNRDWDLDKSLLTLLPMFIATMLTFTPIPASYQIFFLFTILLAVRLWFFALLLVVLLVVFGVLIATLPSVLP